MFGGFKRSAIGSVEPSRGDINPVRGRRMTAMMTCTLLMAGLLGTTSACQQTGVSPEQGPHIQLVISFTWQLTVKWQVEIREYQFRRGMPPKLPTPWNTELQEYREHDGLPPKRAVEVITIDQLVDVPLLQAVEVITIDQLVDVPLLQVQSIESEYSPDLRALFEKAKNQER
jgi:hypothetical protein